jgi:hypothetical protein
MPILYRAARRAVGDYALVFAVGLAVFVALALFVLSMSS